MKSKLRILILLAGLLPGVLLLTTGCDDGGKNTPPGNEVILGIFGGMGPEATSDLYSQILELTPAEKDQDHIPALIFSNPMVPDRMASIRNGGDEILPYLIYSIKKLEDAGASYIAIPCNTVHYFYNEMDNAVDIPIIHMIKETAQVTKARYPGKKKIGLLATTGTIESGLYGKELENLGFEVIVPDDSVEINMVMKAVAGIKAKSDDGHNEDLLALAGQNLMDKGAEVIVLGCTEIPLAYNPERVDLPVVNATKVLAEKAISMFNDLNKED